MERKLFAGAVRSCRATALITGLCLLSLTHQAFASEVQPLSLSETVRQAGAIVLGTVTAKQSRWGDASQRWMVTDYSLSVERVIYSANGSTAINQTVLLSYWGGTIDGETQAISDMRLPAMGERLVMMLRPDWATQAGFSPVVGLNKGLFSVGTPSGGMELVRDADGLALALGTGGQVVRRAGPAMAQAPNVDLTTFLDWISNNLSSIKAAQPEFPTVIDPRAVPVNAKTPALTPSVISGSALSPLRGPSPTGPAAPSVTVPAGVGNEREVPIERLPSSYSSNHQAHLPIVVNNFPASFTPWSPEDQYQMSKWNYYASNVFRVYTNPTATFAWGDGVFDLDGWPSSADMLRNYGAGWDANTIGITYLRFDSGGWIIEADIALNPAFSFTLDDEWVYNGSSAQGFRQVMVHELGHMHGLEHNFNFLSVMNYMPAVFRYFGIPYMDDAAGIRAEYPSNTVPTTDLGVYLYYESGFQSVADATYPAVVTAGNTLTVNNYHIENAGTATISTPTVEWYLSTARNFNGVYSYIGTSTYSSLAPFNYFTPSAVSRTFTVPSGLTPGNYYLGAYIRNDAGADQASFPFSNNYAFSRNPIRVNAAVFSLTVSRNGTGSGTVTSSPSGISCGSTCTTSFAQGTSVTLFASAGIGSVFTGWSGEGCAGTGTCVVSMTQARNVSATFILVPNVTNVTSSTPNGTYSIGASVSIQIAFSTSVTVTGSPQLALNSGGTASYTSGSGTSVLTFTYVVGAGQSSADLDYTSTTALSLNSGTIRGAGVVNATLTLSTPGAVGSLGANKNIVISGGPPSTQLVTVTPCRIMDTRNATGTFGGPFLAGGTARTVPIPSSGCGIPATASAYSLNITVVPRAGALGYLTVWPAGQPQPPVSTLNSPDGSVLANAAIVPAGTGGSISVFASHDTDLVIDINAYFIAPGANSLQFYPLLPCRVLDTRNPNGVFGGPAINGGTSRSFAVPSSGCGAPGTAAAYSLNVTVVPHGGLGYLTAWPTGQTQPLVSTLNSSDGTVLANAAILPAGTGGAVSFFASNTTDLIVDINGYFAPPGTGGLNFYTATPCRLVDTRGPVGTFGGPMMNANTTRTFPLPTGSCNLPTTAAAYSLNMTVVPAGPLGYLATWPTGQPQPVVSTLNAPKGQALANAALVPAGTSGSINVYVSNASNVIIDANGYFQ